MSMYCMLQASWMCSQWPIAFVPTLAQAHMHMACSMRVDRYHAACMPPCMPPMEMPQSIPTNNVRHVPCTLPPHMGLSQQAKYPSSVACTCPSHVHCITHSHHPRAAASSACRTSAKVGNTGSSASLKQRYTAAVTAVSPVLAAASRTS